MSILAHRPFLRATVVNFFFFASLNGFVLLPLHVQQLGGTPVEIGVVMGVYSAVGIVSQPLLGPLIDAVGRRPFMLVGVVVVLASSLLAVMTSAIGWLALVRVLQGFGFSASFVANFAYVIDLVPPAQRGWALGIYGVSGLVSAALAPLLGECPSRARSWACSAPSSLPVTLPAPSCSAGSSTRSATGRCGACWPRCSWPGPV
ncbi:MAG: MFS transporter [Candidatus Rokuibacteriota bacterium]